MAILSFKNVNYYYGQNTSFEKQALKNINLDFEQGTFIGLIGHTGSGKSTLIQHMNGLLKPSSGQVFYNDVDIHDRAFEKKSLCARVGLVFQYPEYQLFETDVLTDVCFGPKNIGCTKEQAVERAVEALKLVGVDEKDFHQSPFELSGGQKRRVAIAGVLAMKPQILVLDEPAAGLDPCGKKEILDMIYHFYKETGMTVILSSHSMEDMAEYAQRLIVMNQGEVVRDGSVSEVFKDYAYLEQIGLSAPKMVYVMNALREMGLPVSADATTVEQAKEEILRLWRM